MIRGAAGYMVRNGPATQQDRWEEDGGYSAFTIAVEISALLAAAEAMAAAGESAIAKYLTETADSWNEQIDDWAYARDTEISRRLGVDGYYMRIGYSSGDAHARSHGLIPIKNRPDGNEALEAGLLISPDALALVRFGLRAADDPRILNTVKAIDALLRRDLPTGSYWYRYNDDGYGEHEDGAPFDGVGVGRLWPLLTGERAHYELAAGRPDEARRLLAALEASASSGGLIPEQIWDAEDIPQRELFLGRPSGGAMPLVWAHAEHIKLLRSLRDNAVFDMPPQTFNRYIRNTPPPALSIWQLTARIDRIAPGRVLRLEFPNEARVHWSTDNWTTTADSPTIATGLGVHVFDLPTEHLAAGSVVRFTMFWDRQNRWQGADFEVAIVGAA
jgi:glucoamylase